MGMIQEQCEQFGISENSFHMVFEGFWDLYCKKPQTPDWNARKLEGWLAFINLRVPLTAQEGEQVAPVEGEEEKEE